MSLQLRGYTVGIKGAIAGVLYILNTSKQLVLQKCAFNICMYIKSGHLSMVYKPALHLSVVASVVVSVVVSTAVYTVMVNC